MGMIQIDDSEHEDLRRYCDDRGQRFGGVVHQGKTVESALRLLYLLEGFLDVESVREQGEMMISSNDDGVPNTDD